jgi:hypothetical protein
VTGDQAVLLGVAGLALVCLALAGFSWRVRRAAVHARAEVAALRQRVDDLERRAEPAPPSADATPSPVEFVITDLGTPRLEPEPVRLDGPAFADIVLKETVIKAASLAQGVRRGLAPATRNRIRFEMKQEVRRSRKQRRADLKARRRGLHARHRAALAEEAS